MVTKTPKAASDKLDLIEYLYYCGGEDVVNFDSVVNLRSFVEMVKTRYTRRDDLAIVVNEKNRTVKLTLNLT